jgi:hypothetical protein
MLGDHKTNLKLKMFCEKSQTFDTSGIPCIAAPAYENQFDSRVNIEAVLGMSFQQFGE